MINESFGDKNAPQNNLKLIKQLLAQVKAKQLPAAFASARKYAEVSSDFSQFEHLRMVENAYKAMMRYDSEFLSDESQALYGNTRESLLRTADIFRFNSQFPANLSRFYNMARTLSAAPISIKAAVQDAEGAENAYILAKDAFLDDEINKAAEVRDEALTLLFNRIWTTPHLSAEDRDALADVFSNEYFPVEIKRQVTAALWLSIQAFYDYAKLDLLALAAVNGDEPTAARGCVAIVLALFRHRLRLSYNPEACSRLNALIDSEDMEKNLRHVVLCLAKASDTDRINKKMQTDILPELQKLHKNFMSRTGDKMDLRDMLNPEKNPEWEDMLENSELAHKLREFTELQLEGSDVMMLPFSQLKGFSFFTTLGNWFLPFRNSHSQLLKARQFDPSGRLISMLTSSQNFLCDSDKYSLVLSLAQTPAQHREMMMSQLGEQLKQLDEDKATSFHESVKPELLNDIMLYIRTLYRFYKLYPQRSEFDDPFANIIDVASLPCLGSKLGDENTQRLLAEFYFSRDYYEQSIPLLKKLLDFEPYENVLQKLGYAYMKIRDYQKAIDIYSKCEIIYGAEKWLLRQLAGAHKAAGNYARAADYYAKAYAQDADNLSLTRQLANTLLHDHRYEDALKLYYKLEYKEGGSLKTWRPVAWCEFMCDNYLAAGKYYDKITESPHAEGEDFINAAHLALVSHDIQRAMENYSRAHEILGDSFRKVVADDIEILKKKGVKAFTVDIILDRIDYGI